MFDDAVADAAILDRYMQDKGKPKGPLHGLPIPVKEHIHLKDTPSSAGFVCWADDFASNDALIIEIFREAGAVFHVKTTNPQSLMVSLVSSHSVYNAHRSSRLRLKVIFMAERAIPHNITLTAGESSGGESAILAMKDSPLGIGTVIGKC